MGSLTRDMSAPTAASLVASRIPDRYATVTLDDYDGTRSDGSAAALAAAHAFLAGKADSMVLVGPPGVGKTMLSAAVCHAIAAELDSQAAVARAEYDAAMVVHNAAWMAWLSDPRSSERPVEPTHRSARTMWRVPAWVNVPAALIDLRREFGRTDQDETERIHGLRSHEGVVVLDDLGREKVSDWTAEVLYVLVNARYEAMLRTIVTSNLTRAELTETGYWPVISRLQDRGLIVEVKAPDQRARSRVRP